LGKGLSVFSRFYCAPSGRSVAIYQVVNPRKIPQKQVGEAHKLVGSTWPKSEVIGLPRRQK